MSEMDSVLPSCSMQSLHTWYSLQALATSLHFFICYYLICSCMCRIFSINWANPVFKVRRKKKVLFDINIPKYNIERYLFINYYLCTLPWGLLTTKNNAKKMKPKSTNTRVNLPDSETKWSQRLLVFGFAYLTSTSTLFPTLQESHWMEAYFVWPRLSTVMSTWSICLCPATVS